MQGAGVQVQAMRFALLIVLTIALASVAFRIDSHSSHTSSSRPPAQLPGSSTPGGPQTAPANNPQSTPTSHPSATPTRHSRPASTGGGAGGGGGGGSGTATQLPVTGWDATMKLGALAFVLIGGGALSIRSAGPSARRQRASVQD